jgi:hypothetical protein
MDLPHALVDGLTLLSDALDDPFTDLEAVLGVLTDDLTEAVPLYLGLTITLHADDCPVVISTLETRDIPIRTSLLLSLLPAHGSTRTGSVVFYSGAVGSFVDLADDARWIFNLDGYPVLDSRLAPVGALADPARVHGLSAFNDINQALGVLIEEGRTLEDARTELHRRAHHTGQSAAEVARHLLGTIPGPAPSSPPDQPATEPTGR